MINLIKGQKITIGDTNITIGLGWKPNDGTGFDFDLDCSAFCLNKTGKIQNENYFNFYGNKYLPEGLFHSDDDTNGGSSEEGDDEFIKIDVNKLNPNVSEIVFIVSIYDAKNRGQNFGQVRDSYIRVFNTLTNVEIAKFELNEDFSIERSIEFGKLYKKGDTWKFDASGVGYNNELDYFVNKYFDGINYDDFGNEINL